MSNAATLKAAEELRAEQAAHRRSEEKIAEMAIELKDAADRYELLKKEHEDNKMERLFWSQFDAPARSFPLSEKMAAIAELHRLSGLAMRSVIDHLWPKVLKLDSYFGFVQRLFGARAQIDAIKRLTCIEGAQMAFAHVKTYWADM